MQDRKPSQIGSREKNDCVICSIHCYTGIDYNSVKDVALQLKAFTPNGAILTHKITELLSSLDLPHDEVTGTRIYNGLFSYKKGPRSIGGHCVAVFDSIAYDNDSNLTRWDIRRHRMSQMRAWLLR